MYRKVQRPAQFTNAQDLPQVVRFLASLPKLTFSQRPAWRPKQMSYSVVQTSTLGTPGKTVIIVLDY